MSGDGWCPCSLVLCFRFGLHLLQNCLPDQSGEWPYQAPIDAELPQRCRPEAVDPGLGRQNCGSRFWRCRPQLKIPRDLGVACPGKIDEVSSREIHTAPAIRAPESP